MSTSHIQEAAYDAFLYPDEPHFWSEPARFAAAAALYGAAPSAVATARILEIGCASGGNIIPMAARYPHAEFYGFDISSKQIDAAKRHADEAGLQNLTLMHADIAALPPNLGTFDYIIAHGICSWIPPQIQTALWQACDGLLREDGLLYLSFNTLPGWHFKNSVRDLLRFHSAQKNDADESFSDILNFFTRVESHAHGIYKHLLGIEKQFMNETDANYIRHEYLEAENHAFYVQEIIREAEAHGMSYVCEADPTSSNLDLLPLDVATHIRADANRNRSVQEQYVDFYINRSFRRSVFGRTAHAHHINHEINRRNIDTLHIVLVDLPPSAKHNDGEGAVAFPTNFFAASDNASYEQKQMLAVQALNYLGTAIVRTSHSIAISDVLQAFDSETKGDESLIDIVRSSIFELLYRRKFALSTEPVAWSRDLTAPQLQKLLRSDALHGRPGSTNVLHERIELTSDQSRLVMSLLDGTRNRAQLQQSLLELFAQGCIVLDDDTATLSSEARISEYLDTMLTKIAELRLLM